MNVLIVGGGGREHALAWKINQSPLVGKLFVAPGNAGTAGEKGMANVDIAATDIQDLADFAIQNDIGLTVIGPEGPLVAGIVDKFYERGLRCFGPNKLAAQLEGSKTFSKAFLIRHNIPTASYQSFTDPGPAKDFLQTLGYPLVIKADGLAAGKGVIIARSRTEAENSIDDMLQGNRFGQAGHRVVIEEFLYGEEASFICMVDGHNIVAMASSQDHKAAHDGDTGPNTGGMGAYSPAPVIDDQMHQRIMSEVMMPTVKGLNDEGIPYTGFLYAGLIIDKQGNPKVLEFNCRFGDPETQPIMMRLQSDLVELCQAAINGELDQHEATWDSRCALGVVLAADGYPEDYDKGHIIKGLDKLDNDDCKVFHAGTTSKNQDIVTSGGRVLCATALGESVLLAQKRAYELAKSIDWQGCWYRADIGHRAIKRER